MLVYNPTIPTSSWSKRWRFISSCLQLRALISVIELCRRTLRTIVTIIRPPILPVSYWHFLFPLCLPPSLFWQRNSKKSKEIVDFPLHQITPTPPTLIVKFFNVLPDHSFMFCLFVGIAFILTPSRHYKCKENMFKNFWKQQ